MSKVVLVCVTAGLAMMVVGMAFLLAFVQHNANKKVRSAHRSPLLLLLLLLLLLEDGGGGRFPPPSLADLSSCV